ncbi:MAG: pyridoxal-phosphate dependent enzyme [Pseudomonadota bacterium]
MIFGPTYDEMLHPEKIDGKIRERALKVRNDDPLDPINLFNITWKDEKNRIYYQVIPEEITGVAAPIVVIYSKEFPTGSHKSGATYSVLMEKQLRNEVDPKKHTLVWPSTGNYGIGGAWVGCRMKYDCLVILPEEMSQERFDRIESYGARYIKTPGCESNVKEIYDKTWELRKSDPDKIRIMNQFEEMANYRFHYQVTGNTIVELASELKAQQIGNGKIAAFVSSMGSSGTIGAGDRIKEEWRDHLIVGLEPVQCPTLYSNGYGGHDIQGIGDKHVTWIHHTDNMDAIMCVDDMECKLGLQLFTDDVGSKFLTKEVGVKEQDAKMLSEIFGISGICNLIGAIKTAKHYRLGKDDVIVTVCTDAIDRYHSVMKGLDDQFGKLSPSESHNRLRHIFHGARTDYILEGTQHARDCWHNLKYYTWVEQQGKTVEELNRQRTKEYWLEEQSEISEVDAMNLKNRNNAIAGR